MNTHRIDRVPITVWKMCNMVKNGQIIQRQSTVSTYNWYPRVHMDCRLIESIILGVPIGPILLAEQVSGILNVEDGEQRLRCLVNYCAGRMMLYSRYADLSGKFFEDLPQKLRNRIEDTTLDIYVLPSTTHRMDREDVRSRMSSVNCM
jgi:hypothetical protein